MTTLIITSGLVSIVVIVSVVLLIEDDKLKFQGRLKKLDMGMGISEEAWNAQQKTEVAKARAKEEFYITLGDRMTLARSKDPEHNLPPIEESLIKLIFASNPGTS